MTQEEKAKAYDKAQEKIKYVIDCGVMVTNDDLKEIFPELKESEDERIRKGLITIYRDIPLYSKVIDDVRAEDIIKWLEKQKPIKWSDEDDAILCELIRRMSALDHYWNRHTDEKLIDWLKSLKPQPKQEWTDEDEDNLNMAIHFMRSENTPYSPIDVEPVVEWLCGLKQRMEE